MKHKQETLFCILYVVVFLALVLLLREGAEI